MKNKEKEKKELKNKKLTEEEEKKLKEKEEKEKKEKKRREREIEASKKQEKERENMVENNKSLKIQLKQLSKKIEEVIADYKEKKLYSIPVNDDNINKTDIQKYNEFVSKIKEQKKNSESFKEMINYDDKFSKIIKEENENKYVKQELKALKKEYESLIKIKEKQEEGKNLLLNNNFNSKQIVDLEKKLKKLKKDYNELNKDYMSSNIIIKEQYNEINSLKDECDLIEENIKLKEKQKTKSKYINLVEINIKLSNNIRRLKNEINEKIIASKNQEESYKKELNLQIKHKKKLLDEVYILEKKLDSYNQSKKLNDFKLKEIKKIKDELNKNKIKEKSEFNLQKYRLQKDNLKKNNLIKLLENPTINKMNFDLKNFFIEDTKISNKSIKKPNLNISKFNSNSKSSINIFSSSHKMTREEKKLKKEKEKEEFINKIGKELEEHEKQRGKMIEEIEYLKDDIEKMLNKNENIDKNIDDIKKEKNEKLISDNIDKIDNNKEIENQEIKKSSDKPFDFNFSKK